MKKTLLWIPFLFSGMLAASASIAGYTISNRIMYMKKKDEDLILQREVKAKRYDEIWYAAIRKSEKWIQSPNGYQLKAIFMEPLNSNYYVIICHGVTENKVNSFKYARMFERLGYNSVIYDHRRHGESGGDTTSFGHYEKLDLQAVVSALKEHAGDELIFGIHGESMGAATMLLYAGAVEDAATFYISDCAYSDISEQLLHVIRTTTPIQTAFAIRLAGVFLKLRDGYSIKTVSPRQAVPEIQKPVLFIHSEPDEFVLPKMTEELYRLKKGPKELKLFKTGAHAQSFNEHSEDYENAIKEFLLKFNLLPQEKALR